MRKISIEEKQKLVNDTINKSRQVDAVCYGMYSDLFGVVRTGVRYLDPAIQELLKNGWKIYAKAYDGELVL